MHVCPTHTTYIQASLRLTCWAVPSVSLLQTSMTWPIPSSSGSGKTALSWLCFMEAVVVLLPP